MQTSVTYLGVDIAKASLDLSAHAGHGPMRFTNDPAGGRRMLKRLTQITGPVQIICEATGGYERLILRMLAQAGVPATLVNPRRARDFARATGLLAKTDRLDAEALAEYGRRLQPAPTPPPSPEQQRLHALVGRRHQLVELIQQEQVRQEHYEDGFVRRQASRLLRTLEKHLEEVEQEITALVQAQAPLQKKIHELCSIQAVGPRTAWTLLAVMPELGTLRRGEAAALAGVAPYNYDSGPFRGQRHVAHGRPLARRALYMAALVAARHNPVLSAVYRRLREKGKPAKVALVALMRKLIEFANLTLQRAESQLSESAASRERQLAPPTA